MRDSNETIGECIARTLNNNSPDLKIDVFTTHWYPYVCGGNILGITGESVLKWGGNGGPSYQKMSYPEDIVKGMSWLGKYSVTQNSVIGIGELNPMGNCTNDNDSTGRLNLTWGGAFWHLDVLGIMAKAGIKYSQKHIHVSGGGGQYEAIIFANGRVYKTPPYYAYRFYSQYFGYKVVGSQSSDPATLNSHASLDKDGNLRLLLINKSVPAVSQKARIVLNNFNASNNGSAYLMKIPTYFESPSGFNPENPSIYSTVENVPVGNSFEYTVPAYSAVILKIPRDGGPINTITPTSTPVPFVCSCSGNANVLPKSKGNANCDSAIDALDFNFWLEQFRSGLSQTDCADFDGDGKVDGIDFEYWRRGRF